MNNPNAGDLKQSHTPRAIQKRFKEGIKHSYLKDFIYGAIDGTVTTFAVVSGVAGAQLASKIILILGFANLLGDGFSMAVSNYLGTKAEEQLREKARLTEENHIQEIPEGEKEEIRQIFAGKGFKGEELEHVVKVITSDRKQWINTMLQEELGIPLRGPSPWKAGASTFTAFFVIGLIPLLPFVAIFLNPSLEFDAFKLSIYMTGCAFFAIGALKAQFVNQRWYRAGFETLVIGGAAAFLAYLAGYFLKGIVG